MLSAPPYLSRESGVMLGLSSLVDEDPCQHPGPGGPVSRGGEPEVFWSLATSVARESGPSLSSAGLVDSQGGGVGALPKGIRRRS